jgi:DNA helicase-2/ATP-dependent DNA helicase PcrA
LIAGLDLLSLVSFNFKIKLDYLKQLNEPQAQAVQTVEGPVMIIAGAGSGKTRVLTYRIAYLIEHGVDPFNILSLTFTNKAAREMKDRIGKVIGPSEAKNIWMGTFHSVFSKILRSEAEKINYPANFTIYDSDDSKNLIKTIVTEMGLDDKVYKASLVQNRISGAKNSLINALAYKMNEEIQMDDREARRPKLGAIYEKYAQRCFKASAMDFDDLLLKTFELFNQYPDVLHKYQHRFKFVLVDEFQDTNSVQYAIIKQLSALYQNICVVGDDAQSIYAFRGADIGNILNFKKDYPDLKTYKLEQNYRSTKNIVAAANSVIEKNKNQLEKLVWTSNAEGNKINVIKAVTDNEEGSFVANAIFSYRMNHQRANRDFAVLYRTNVQSRAIEESLRRMNIPYRVYGGLSFYQRREIKDVLSYFRLCVNHNDEEALKRIINYPTRGIGKSTLDKIIVASAEHDLSVWQILENIKKLDVNLSPAVAKKVDEFKQMIEGFEAIVQQRNAFDAASFIASSSGLLKDLYTDKTPEGVNRYENVQELLNGIKEFTEINKDHKDGNSLTRYMEDIALITDADKDEDEEKDRVTLMTIHASKGLEFPYVFVVGLEENLFPSQLSINSRDELEEERRLFYVAITRAMDQLTFSYAQSRFKYGNLIHSDPSRFLHEVDEAYLDFSQAGSQQRIFQGKKIDSEGLNLNSYSIPAHSHLKKVSIASKSPVKGDPVGSFKAGLDVVHARFGKGKIVSIDGNGDNKMATIRFEKDGEKKLLLKFAKLQVVRD